MTEPTGTLCFHCGEALPRHPQVFQLDGVQRLACCSGCAAAAVFIRDAGLADYYRIRSASGARSEQADYAAWDRQDVLGEHSIEIDGGREITVLSDHMRCAACAWLIDRALSREPAVREVQANAVTGRIRIRWNPALQPLSQLLQRLAGLGYLVHLAPDAAHEAQRLRERRTLLTRLGVAILGSLQAMMLAEALYLDFDNEMNTATRDFLRWITLLLSTPVVFYSGWPFIEGLLRELRARRPGMDTLVGLSILLAWAASAIETVRGGPHVWFDAAIMFVMFLLAARSLEIFARQRANAVVERLARARPALATRVLADSREQVPISAVAAGDVLSVAAGEAIPADGLLLEPGEFDESLISGESMPQARLAGESVLAGSQCLSMPVTLRVQRTGADTRLSQLVRTIEAAQNQRPKLAQWADRVASRFVIGLLLAAALTWAIWQWIDPSRAFEVALAVLVVSCPCALSLAVPTALAAAHAQLARIGLLALRNDALEHLASIDTLVFDKTGTLSEGRPALDSVETFDGASREHVLALAAALETASGHPLAAAFRSFAEDTLQAEQVQVQAGRGVTGVIAGRSYRLGRAEFAGAAADDGALWLSEARHPLARFECSDRVRADAAAAVRELRALGLDLHIASGDAFAAVRRMAQQVGIAQFSARCAPEDKLAAVRTMQQQGRRVGMIGDGINDAPVLAGADVSIAIGAGASLAHRAADLVLTHSRLGAIAEGIQLARRARRIMRQNLLWAVLYNLLALPFAMLGWVPPWLAALGMTASSLLVTVNALRVQGGRTASASAQPSSADQPLATGKLGGFT